MNDGCQLLRAQSLDGLPGLHRFTQCILKIIFNDHRHHICTVGVGPRLHRQNLSGHGRMDRDAKPGIITDLLAHRNHVSLLHQGLTGCADVHGHGNHHSFWCRKTFYGHLTGQRFFIVGMYPAEKTSHILHLS